MGNTHVRQKHKNKKEREEVMMEWKDGERKGEGEKSERNGEREGRKG